MECCYVPLSDICICHVLKHNQNLILMDHIWQCTVHQQSVSEFGGRKSTVIISLNINQVTLITCG